MKARLMITAFVAIAAIATQARAGPPARDVEPSPDVQIEKMLALESFAAPALLVNAVVSIDSLRIAEFAVALDVVPAEVSEIVATVPTHVIASTRDTVSRHAKPPNRSPPDLAKR